ncbi:MAG TPA: multicopper oxidase family protein [Chloroflexota bacterium]|jgi:FtsP/CotA-like multicopper oxidase with cupredoxin domain
MRASVTVRGAARPALSRRGFLRLGAAGLLAGAVSGGRAVPWVRAGGGGGVPLVEPPVRVSRDGLLDTSLTPRLGGVRIGDQVASTEAYDGAFTGPTLRVRAGDLLRIALVNRLPEETNLHSHGLHVSPSGNADNVFIRVQPGETFQYEYELPADHPAGLYWYHPHFYGNSDAQVFGGLAGALIVEGELDRLPGIAGLPERLLALQATYVDAQGQVRVGDEGPTFPLLKLVNGQLNPLLAIRPGETQRWRIGNFSADTYFLLQLDGHTLHVIDNDGNPLDAVQARDQLLFPPGKRYEVLVQGGPPGSYALRTLPFDKGQVSMGGAVEPEAVLATLVSAGPPVAPQALPTVLIPFVDLRDAAVDAQREITFDVPPMGSGGMAGMAAGATAEMQPIFEINGKQFDANAVDTTVRLGSTEEWVIRNTSAQVHPFHIHVNPFQVVATNGQPFQAASYEDTVNLPALGSVTMRTRFLDFPGKFVYHCHILMHEDNGMMAVIEVQP